MSVKEKGRPKNPLSAYACFIQVIRDEHKKKHPQEHVDFSEFSRKCAEKWRSMTETEKKRFEDMAAADRERYNNEMQQFPAIRIQGGPKRKIPRDPTKPKRAWSAFFFFCDEFRPILREQHPEWRFGDIAKELGRLWEVCDDKGKYEHMASDAKLKYEEEMVKYRLGTFVPEQSVISMDQPSAINTMNIVSSDMVQHHHQVHNQVMPSNNIQVITQPSVSPHLQHPQQYIMLSSQPHNIILQQSGQPNIPISTHQASPILTSIQAQSAQHFNNHFTIQQHPQHGLTLVPHNASISGQQQQHQQQQQTIQSYITQPGQHATVSNNNGVFTFLDPSSLQNFAFPLHAFQQPRQMSSGSVVDLQPSIDLT